MADSHIDGAAAAGVCWKSDASPLLGIAWLSGGVGRAVGTWGKVIGDSTFVSGARMDGLLWFVAMAKVVSQVVAFCFTRSTFPTPLRRRKY